MISRDLLKKDLKQFFKKKKWDGQAFLELMKKYDATPEMFLYRLSQLIPKLFNLQEIYYLRFNNKAGLDQYPLTKELNMSRVRVPHGIGLNEHYCRRWLSIELLKALAAKEEKAPAPEILISAQRSHFIGGGDEFFTLTLARSLSLTEGANSSISLGFLINDEFKNKVSFWNDPAIPKVDVNETCERCELTDAQCSDRVAPPEFFLKQESQVQREQALEKFGEKMKGAKV